MSFHRNSSFHPAEQWYAQPLSALPTPSVVIDRAVFVRNSARMLEASRKLGMEFRIHIKTHKTSEGTKIQLDPFAEGNKAGKEENGNEERLRATRLIVSTVEEGWMLVNSGVLRECAVKSVLYSLPPAPNTLQRLNTLRAAMRAKECTLLLMVDHPAQIAVIEKLPNQDDDFWYAFIKVDAGYHRAGVPVHTRQFEDTVKAVIEGKNTRLYGFYVHAGNSYGATSKDEANAFLDDETKAVNEASSLAREIINADDHLQSKYRDVPFVLSVGATPTANAARERSESGKTRAAVANAGDELELHAGNYSLYDLQQFATSMIDQDQIGVFVLSTVCSVYPGRNSEIGEALCDAGGLAMSKDKGPIPGHGVVRSDPKQGLQGWSLGRIAQEHGVLTYSPPANETGGAEARLPEYGEKLRILPQHACMTLANHPWFYVVDSSLEQGTEWEDWSVRDVWTPAKFW